MTILIVDDEKSLSDMLKINFKHKNYDPVVFESAEDAISYMKVNDVDIVILDINLKKMDGVTALGEIKKISSDVEVVMLTGDATVQRARDSLKMGAFDFLTKPCNLEELNNAVSHAAEKKLLKKENLSLHAVVETFKKSEKKTKIIGNDPKITEILKISDNIAPTDCSVLILGDSGTGKELIARRIHETSLRKEKNFIAINCGAIPANLMESEFFGYEKGAFTGAGGRKIGIFEAFDEGTVFLDEIGDLPLHMQVKLLRVLETGEFQRIGSTKTIKVNIRVISATNKDLDFETFKGHFRQDLYYRLNVITLKLPPLKERPDDIPLLAEYFLKRFNAQFRKNISGFDQRAKEMLKGYSWPGNIRELENIIERTAILCTGNIIDVESLPLSLKSGRESSVLGISDEQPDERLSIDSIEREHILKVLKKNNFHRLKTANELNISERTLYRKLKRYDING